MCDDFKKFTDSLGLTDDQLASAKLAHAGINLPKPTQAERQLIRIQKSDIEGEGVFAAKRLVKGVTIPLIASGKWTLSGIKANHSPKPNFGLVNVHGSVSMFAARQVEKGEEITIDYWAMRELLFAPMNTTRTTGGAKAFQPK